MPLPHLGAAAGVTLPGGLLNTRVPPPAWVRLQFSGIPDDVQVTLYGHTGVRVAAAKTAGGERAASTIRELPFKPDGKLSYALAFTRAPGADWNALVTFGVDAAFGEGRPRSARESSARRSGRRPSRRKRTRS
jgi:hypothetical protein